MDLIDVEGMPIDTISCERIIVVAKVTIGDDFLDKECQYYFPANFLVYIEKGCTNYSIGDDHFAIKEGQMALIKCTN